jgi:hypothetical protein
MSQIVNTRPVASASLTYPDLASEHSEIRADIVAREGPSMGRNKDSIYWASPRPLGEELISDLTKFRSEGENQTQI